jgi:hypothetical protein
MAKLADLFVKLGLNNSQFNKGLKDSEKKTSIFGEGVKKIGGLIAGAFAVTQIVEFGKELVKLSGEAQGVIAAFEKIEGSRRLLNDLKEATRGTVSELDLMKRVIQARNFKIPLEQLATLFEFATNRAIETGESVDFLVDSIVTGLGRKSILILDNLGISAVELQEEVKKVGDFSKAAANIIQREMAAAGEVADTTTIAIQSIGAAWEDFKLQLSQSEQFINFVNESLRELKEVIAIATSDLSTFRKVSVLLFGTKEKWTELAGEIDNWGDSLSRRQGDIDRLNDGLSQNTDDLNKNTNALKNNNAARREEAPERMATRGETPLISAFGRIDLDEPLADMDSFFARMDQQLADFTEDYLADWVNFSEQLDMLIVDNIVSLADEFGQAIEAIFAGDFNIEELGARLLKTIGNFLGEFGKMLIAYGIAQEAFWTSLGLGPLGAGVAIAAGVALVAIGGAISGLGGRVSKGNLSTGGGGGDANAFNVITTNAQDQQLVAKVTGNQIAFVLDKRNRDLGNV